MSQIEEGTYKGRGVAGSAQFGFSNSGGDQLSLELDVFIDGNPRRLTTILAFSGDAKQYSIERLQALGWDGSEDLNGIDKNEVDVEIYYQEYNGKEQMRVQIRTVGKFSFKNEMNATQKRSFMAGLAREAKRAGIGGQSKANDKGYPDSFDEDSSGESFDL